MPKSHARKNLDAPPNASVYSPERWGLPREVVEKLGERLHAIWQRFHLCFTAARHNTSEYALHYLKGLLLLPRKRNYKNIARRVIASDCDGQNLQHFISDSPWSAAAVFDQIKSEIRHDRRLQGGMLSLDESGDVRAGDQSAGAAPQYIGNVGKIAMGQVGVALGYYAAEVWAMVDAELFLPQVWFDEAHKKMHRRLHIPEDRTFQTKLEIGLALLDRARKAGLPFTRLSCDAFYGGSNEFRAAVAQRDFLYLADIPSDLQVYRQEPRTGIPRQRKGRKGRRHKRARVLNHVKPIEVRTLAQLPEIKFESVEVRACERGCLRYDCAAISVWTLTKAKQPRREWLFIRRESDGDLSYSFSNAPEATPLAVLAQWRAERYFIERTFQDAKSEGGWDELVARKYRAWMHHTALDALALWFMAQTKLDWAQAHPRDPKLLEELQLERLPALSMANLRELLLAVMPLKQLTIAETTAVVVRHLVERCASTRSRIKTQRQILKERKRKPPT